jgi:tetratricopeptide (TPR) repeat protein
MQSRTDTGVSLYKQNRYDEALDHLTDFSSDSVMFWRGMCLWHLNNGTEALRNFKKSIELEPNEPQPHFFVARILFSELDQFEAALEHINKALSLDQTNANYHNQKGHILVALKQYKEALQSFTRTIELDNEKISAYEGGVTCAMELKQFENALKFCESWLALDKFNHEAYLTKSMILGHLGRLDESKMFNIIGNDIKKRNVAEVYSKYDFKHIFGVAIGFVLATSFANKFT